MMVLTAARPKGRQAAVLLTYEKTDISEEIAPDLESFKPEAQVGGHHCHRNG